MVVSPSLSVTVTVPTCAPGGSGAHQVFIECNVKLRRCRVLAHEDGVCAGEHRLYAVGLSKAHAHGRDDNSGCNGTVCIVGKGVVEQRPRVLEARG